MSERKLIPGKFVWYEHVSSDAKKAQQFYAEVLGWKVSPFPMGGASYEMITIGDAANPTMIGGYDAARPGQASHWIGYISVDDVEGAVQAAVDNGGKVVQAPHDIPEVGRSARNADPQGAEMAMLKSASGDNADVANAPVGQFFWNELHTTAPEKALAFYEKALGLEHRSMPMGPNDTYHIVSRGGVDRGGATGQLQAGVTPHWLPYVHIDDVDAAAARAQKLGATILVAPADIPGIGRFSVFQDPTGAVLAMMKPLPRDK